MALYADLHRHLGGSVVPRILWRYFKRHNAQLAQQFPEYPEFEDFYTRPRNTLDEYLELHTLVESVQRSETLPYFIIGFDGEKPGAGARIVQLVEQTAIPVAMLSMLQALPHTALWHRLEKEGRLLNQKANINQTTLMNFVPTRPLEDIAQEYIDAFRQLYDPQQYLDRVFRHFMKIRATHPQPTGSFQISGKQLRALLLLLWRQGVVRQTRTKFWFNLFQIIQRQPRLVSPYLTVCAYIEHFLEYRQIVCEQITTQLAAYLATNPSGVTQEERNIQKSSQIAR